MIERLGTRGGGRRKRKTGRGKGENEGDEKAGKGVAEGKRGETLKCLTK